MDALAEAAANQLLEDKSARSERASCPADLVRLRAQLCPALAIARASMMSAACGAARDVSNEMLPLTIKLAPLQTSGAPTSH